MQRLNAETCRHFVDKNKTFVSPIALGTDTYWVEEPDSFDENCTDRFKLRIETYTGGAQRFEFSKNRFRVGDSETDALEVPNESHWCFLTKKDAENWIKENVPDPLPCKEDDILYCIKPMTYGNYKMYKFRASCIGIADNVDGSSSIVIRTKEHGQVPLDDFGVSVFTDPELAEKVLKEQCNNTTD
jgi:hypothetical protein